MTATIPRGNQREHILDQALELMSASGSAGMSMRQLALACGVQVAAIYHYFPSKDALLQSVVQERRYDTRLAEGEDLPPIDPAAPLADRVRAVFSIFWTGALEEEPVLRLLLGEALRNQPAAMPTGMALLEVLGTGVQAMLAEHAPELADPDTVARVFTAQIFAGFISHIFDPEADIAAIGAELADVVVRVATASDEVSA